MRRSLAAWVLSAMLFVAGSAQPSAPVSITTIQAKDMVDQPLTVLRETGPEGNYVLIVLRDVEGQTMVTGRLTEDQALSLAEVMAFPIGYNPEPRGRLSYAYPPQQISANQTLSIATNPDLAKIGGALLMIKDDSQLEPVVSGFCLTNSNRGDVRVGILQAAGTKGRDLLNPRVVFDPKFLRGSQKFVRNQPMRPTSYNGSEAFVELSALGLILSEQERLLVSVDSSDLVFVSNQDVGGLDIHGDVQSVPLFATLQSLGYNIVPNDKMKLVDCYSPAAYLLPPPNAEVEQARQSEGSNGTYNPGSYSPGPYSSSGSKHTPGTDVHVRSYFRKDGTYVQSHTRSAPHKK